MCGNPVPDANHDAAWEEPGSATATIFSFLVAFAQEYPTSDRQDDAIGCVGLRRRDDVSGFGDGARVGELKRMYVLPRYRGRGLSHALAEAVETYAKNVLGFDVLVLETGCRQIGALKLSERRGWTKWDYYGEYIGAGVDDGGVSMCYQKRL